MTARSSSVWGPIFTALAIWFAHFMLCWAAAEVWPHQWAANVLAWGLTALALLCLGVHAARVRARHAQGELAGWSCRFAQGAAAIATAAVLFGALPSMVFVA